MTTRAAETFEHFGHRPCPNCKLPRKPLVVMWDRDAGGVRAACCFCGHVTLTKVTDEVEEGGA